MKFFTDIEKKTSEIHIDSNYSKWPKQCPEKNAEEAMAKFKLHYRIMVTKQYGSGTTDNGKTRYTEWNSVFHSNHTDTQLQPPEFSYICQKHTLEERKPLQQRVLGRQISIYQRFKLDPRLSPGTKLNSKWIRNQQ